MTRNDRDWEPGSRRGIGQPSPDVAAIFREPGPRPIKLGSERNDHRWVGLLPSALLWATKFSCFQALGRDIPVLERGASCSLKSDVGAYTTQTFDRRVRE
jgi:hypothetical protein